MRDLEIALVLAREMKAAAARSVDASLRLDQLQEVFGVEELDRAERARIQTALQMAGLEPFPSLLEAEPDAPIRFGASKAAAVAGTSAGAAGAPPEPPAPPPEEPSAADAPPTFPTVGQFARSKLRRRRFGVRRGDHGDGDGQVPPAPPAEEAASPPPVPLPAEEPLYRHGDALADAEEDVTRAHEVPAEYVETNGHGPEHMEGVTEIHYEVEPEPGPGPERDVEAESDVEAEHDEPATDVHHDVVDEPAGDPAYEPADEDHVPEPELEPHAEDEREYIPLVRPEQVTAAAPIPEPAAPAAPGAPGGGARTAEVAAALLPAVVIPVVVTSIAGWRFGLPFVALSVIATGFLFSRRGDAPGGEKRGLFGTLRGSAGARTALVTTAVVTVLAVGASIALTAVDDSGSSGGDKTATPAEKPTPPQSSAPKPAAPAPKKSKKKASKPKAEKQTPPAAASEPQPTTTEPQPTTTEPQPDPATRGLIRVPPSSAAQPTTTTPQQTP